MRESFVLAWAIVVWVGVGCSSSPLGRAVNLTLCQGALCSELCAIR